MFPVNVLKVLTFPFLFSNKYFGFRAVIHKMVVRIVNREESDLGLHCLTRFCLACSKCSKC